MPEGKMKIANQKHAKALAKFREVKPETIKWQDEKGQFLPVEVSTDERFRFGKTLIFVHDINITSEQDLASHSLPLIKISVKPFLLVINSDPVNFFSCLTKTTFTAVLAHFIVITVKFFIMSITSTSCYS